MSGASILLRNVTKSFHRGSEIVHAVNDVTLEINSGRLTALMGPSGSGKSTLLNLISGWESPDAGTIEITGIGADPFDWASTALLPQRLGLLEDLSVGENVELPLVLARWDPATAAARVGEVLNSLDLGDLAERHPRDVSVGEQQRAAFARAVVIAPSILLADEPTGNQDSGRGATILRQMAAAAAAGATCVIATHDPEVLTYCDRVIRMHAGTVEGDERKQDRYRRSPWERQP